MDNSLDQIKQLAAQHFSDLTKAEIKVLESAVTGGLADCRDVDTADVDPEKAMDWNGERAVRATLIRWLCTNKDTLGAIHSAGLSVAHAKFDGEIDLVGISIGFSLGFFACAISDGLKVQDATLRNLNLGGSLCGFLLGERLTTNGSVFLRKGFKANGPVTLVGASIGGDLECNEAHFRNTASSGPQRPAVAKDVVLLLDRAEIGGRLLLSPKFQADGIVHMVGTTIKGPLDCTGAKIGTGINMRDAQSRSINISGATCPYLIADRVDIKGSLFLRNGFLAEGGVVLLNAKISGDLDCNGSFFGNVSPLRAEAEKSFGANIPKIAINLNGSSIGGYGYFGYGFEAKGGVSLNGVNIGVNLHCTGGHFLNNGKAALQCQFTTIRGAAIFRSAEKQTFQTDGFIDLFGSNVGGSLSFSGAEFLGETPNGVRLENCSVGGTLQWKNVRLSSKTQLNLSHAKALQVEDDDNSWPGPGRLKLNGFSYGAIAGVPVDSRGRKKWLRSHIEYLKRQAKDDFSLQPFRQLADTLRRAGYEDNARQVLIEMHKARRDQGGLSKFGRLWSWVLQCTIGFGYRSHWAFAWALLFVVIGAVLFHLGDGAGLMVATKAETKATGEFSSLGYSLDTFLPIINLHQEESWIPTGNGRWGRLLQYYYWLHIGLGWALITLGVAGFTGLIRKE